MMRFTCVLIIFALLSTCHTLDEGAFGAFWNQQAHFEFVSASFFPTPGDDPGLGNTNVGSDFIIRENIWYLFHREVVPELTPSGCK